MRAPEPVSGIRIVATPQALDRVPSPEGIALRFASDEILIIGATSAELADEHSIVEDESGFVGWWLTADELTDVVLPHLDWPLPSSRPALAQGLVAGVPAKIWLTDDRALLLCAAAYAHELAERLP